MLEALSGLERILGRKLNKIESMSALTVTIDDIFLGVRSINVNGGNEEPHIHVLTYKPIGKASDRFGKGFDLGKMILEPGEYKQSDFKMQDLHYKGKTIKEPKSDKDYCNEISKHKKDIINKLNEEVKDNKKEFKGQTYNDLFIKEYLENVKDNDKCPRYDEFEKYLEDKKENALNKEKDNRAIANELVNNLINISYNANKDIEEDNFIIEEINGENVISIIVFDFGIWENDNDLSKKTSNEIESIMKEFREKYNANISGNPIGNKTLYFKVKRK